MVVRRRTRRYLGTVDSLERREMFAAAVSATAFEPLTFPDLNTAAGALTAMLLSENRNPEFSSFNLDAVKLSMRAMRAAVANRLAFPKLGWGVTNPASELDIIGAPGQFDGFSRTASGVAVTQALRNRIQAIINRTNNPNALQTRFQEFITAVRAVVNSPVSDPLEVFGGAFGWRTAGAADPGGWQEKVPAPDGVIMGNQFYTVRGVDLVFVIDSTGSMDDDIAAVKAAAQRVVDEARKATDFNKHRPNVRFGIVTYKDPGEVTTVLPFTRDVDATKNGINSIEVSGGGDYPEGVNSGLIHALRGEGGLGGWRAKPMLRRIILMGDAPAKDTELTSQVTDLARETEIDDRITPEPFRPKALSVAAARRLLADPARIYPVIIGGDTSAAEQFRHLASTTGGQSFTAATATDVVDALVAAINAAVDPSPVDKLRVVSIARLLSSNRRQLLGIEVRFSEAPDAATVAQLQNYTLSLAGRDKRFSTRDDVKLAIASVTHTAGSTVVRISLVSPITNPKSFSVRISGILSARGGALLGVPGSPNAPYFKIIS